MLLRLGEVVLRLLVAEQPVLVHEHLAADFAPERGHLATLEVQMPLERVLALVPFRAPGALVRAAPDVQKPV